MHTSTHTSTHTTPTNPYEKYIMPTDTAPTLTAPTLTLTKPQELMTLATSGWLVTARVRTTTMRITDRSRSDQYATANKATDNKSVDISLNLLRRYQPFRDCLNHRQTVKNWLLRITYAWDGATRYLLNDRLGEFHIGWKEMCAEMERLLDVAEAGYEQAITNDAFERGEMFDRSQYPDFSEIRRRFKMQCIITEVPTGDYRTQITQDAANDLYNDYNRQVSNIVAGIANTQATTMISVLQSLKHSCDETEVTRKDGTRTLRRNKLVESTYEKALHLCDAIAQCNPSNNQALYDARQGLVSALTASDGTIYSLDALRSSDSVREQVMTKVTETLNTFLPVAPVAADEEEDF